jgi:hypothetical protein
MREYWTTYVNIQLVWPLTIRVDDASASAAMLAYRLTFQKCSQINPSVAGYDIYLSPSTQHYAHLTRSTESKREGTSLAI